MMPFEGLDVLTARIQREIAEEFPGWNIERTSAGDWKATRGD